MELSALCHQRTATCQVPLMQPATAVSVVVVHYRETEEVIAALHSVQAQSPHLELELIVIDNEGSPKARDRVLEAFPNIRWSAAPDNPGFAAAVNFGVSIAQHEWILLLNPDTRLQNKALEICLETAAQWPDSVDIIGCRHQNRDGSFQSSAFPRASWPGPLAALANQPLARPLLRYLDPDALAQKLPDTAREQQSRTHTTDAVQGSFLLVRREAIHEIGDFDDDYFLYCEELDFCRRLREQGGTILFCAEACVVHGGSIRRYSRDRQQQAALSEDLFVWKRMGAGGYALYLGLRYLNLLTALVFWPMLDRASQRRVQDHRRAWQPSSWRHLAIPFLFGRHPGSSASSLRQD